MFTDIWLRFDAVEYFFRHIGLYIRLPSLIVFNPATFRMTDELNSVSYVTLQGQKPAESIRMLTCLEAGART